MRQKQKNGTNRMKETSKKRNRQWTKQARKVKTRIAKGNDTSTDRKRKGEKKGIHNDFEIFLSHFARNL